MQYVQMVISGLLMGLWPLKVVLNCATTTSGELSVISDGMTVMLVWSVDKLDFL